MPNKVTTRTTYGSMEIEAYERTYNPNPYSWKPLILAITMILAFGSLLASFALTGNFSHVSTSHYL